MKNGTIKHLPPSHLMAKAGIGGELPSIIITSPAVDRENDRAIPERLRMAPKVPVLFAHDYQELPVGDTVRAELDALRRTRAYFKWLQGDERADRVRNAFDQGFLSASIGARVDWQQPNDFGGYDFGGEIIEFSLCPVPANPECVRGLKRLGLWRSGDTVINLSSIPSPGRALTRLLGNDPEILVAGLTHQQVVNAIARAVGSGVREVIGEKIAEAAARAILKARGRVD
jgi:hypothetical protein